MTRKNKKNKIVKRVNHGTIEYAFNGKLHREDGPALIGEKGSVQVWYINGKRHRKNGPAVIVTVDTYPHIDWYIHGEFSRLDGPAMITRIDAKYFIYGKYYREEDYIKYLLEHYPKEISFKNLLDSEGL